jgi:hypothetical protein
VVELGRLVGLRDFGEGDPVGRVTRSAVNYVNILLRRLRVKVE